MSQNKLKISSSVNIQNRRARGNQRYSISKNAPGVEWSSKNMYVLGVVILAFLVVHLIQFWAKMQLLEFCGSEAENPYMLLEQTFGSIWVLIIYIAWFCAVWFHLCHGFWSMFQTVGWDNQVWMKRLKVFGIIVATIIWVMFTTVAVNAFLHANGILAA